MFDFCSFTKKFDNIMQEVDFCITRAGASTLAELSVLNIPFLAVPLPSSKDNHQFENANFYKNMDCCWIIEQNYFEEKIGVDYRYFKYFEANYIENSLHLLQHNKF